MKRTIREMREMVKMRWVEYLNIAALQSPNVWDASHTRAKADALNWVLSAVFPPERKGKVRR